MPYVAKLFCNCEQARWPTQVEVGVLGNPEIMKQLERKMTWPTEVQAEPVSPLRTDRRSRTDGTHGA